ncbi:putative DNA modification/repair radical SAM protein [Flavilitoribacter nigricans]|uniref:Putative DNA modification/repair radical SAM protein n=1 Tax=Flavilitoribacter nigricans (strain ATCC 23147 / DSM 23189 / NBRC 102662 / NCIMB 1420 / SS-2) TaxID=1122177 RepID=A0A2D0NHM5_FLAN2|nr:putative DNA modification/repair radical SAM protein [Flavilitoribacter nigricans]PHN07880.1 putative DNA modification/repair radical SAM protein [Flavilitoribacter nigricans DSM 23189 = NBRC 102662]
MNQKTQEKLEILADAAKYDVSCSSSGSKRKNTRTGLGNSTGSGICHTYTEDGRCVSLLKILLTNFCIYDCAYCVSRSSNDIKRAAFTVDEVVDLTINFYRRNYIEGLFLSSGIFKNADYTMERLVRIAKKLRLEHQFNGYIHLKAIPGASEELLDEAGLYADRLSVNIEIPSEMSLKKVAPEKNYKDVLEPMGYLKTRIKGYKEERKQIKKAPLFAPAGQSTQLVVGATPENDLKVLQLADSLYQQQSLKRVYYSGYIPIPTDNRLPVLKAPPLVRENRLYQADWLLRFYGFKVDEIVSEAFPELDLEMDPKMAYALRHPALFPVDVNKADYEMILRIPGVGVKSAQKIIQARRFGQLRFEHLKKIGVVLKRARYFLVCADKDFLHLGWDPDTIRSQILHADPKNRKAAQLSLF